MMLGPGRMPAVCSSFGTLCCLGTATAFGAMAIPGKLAYDGGATVGTLLAVRFALAAGLFWALVLTVDPLGAVQVLGGGPVLGGVLVLRARPRAARRAGYRRAVAPGRAAA